MGNLMLWVDVESGITVKLYIDVCPTFCNYLYIDEENFPSRQNVSNGMFLARSKSVFDFYLAPWVPEITFNEFSGSLLTVKDSFIK
jgi:hypothetical protein